MPHALARVWGFIFVWNSLIRDGEFDWTKVAYVFGIYKFCTYLLVYVWALP